VFQRTGRITDGAHVITGCNQRHYRKVTGGSNDSVSTTKNRPGQNMLAQDN